MRRCFNNGRKPFPSWIECGKKCQPASEEAQADIEQAIAEGRAEKVPKRSKAPS